MINLRVLDSFKLALNNIIHRKLRAWLTLLGIIIGVAAVVSIVSIGNGATASVNQQLSRFGADILTISPGHSRAGGFSGFRGGDIGGGGRNTGAVSTTTSSSVPELTPRDVMIIKGNQYITAVCEMVSGNEDLTYMSEKIRTQIQGVNPSTWPILNDLNVVSGRLLTPSDSSAIVIGDRLANSTFKQPITLGRTVTINGQGFIVVGILSSTSGNGVYMNYTSAWKVTDVNVNTFSDVQAKVISTDDMNDATNEITNSLLLSRKVTSANQDFSISSSEAMKAQIQSLTTTLTLFLGAIALISLIVGAIGVANSMFTSVLEKTKDIGIMKALGSTNSEILQMFLFESALFGLAGGILGAILGTVISYAISIFGLGLSFGGGPGGMSATTLVTPGLVLLAISVSTIIGIISGLAPARLASKLKPIDALRYE